MIDPAYCTPAWPWVGANTGVRTPGLWIAANELPVAGGHPRTALAAARNIDERAGAVRGLV